MFGDFLTLAMDSLVNQMSKYWFLTQEQVSVPLSIRSVVGAGGRFGAIHSQMPASWFMGVPGIKIVAPSTPADAKALLKAAIRDDNPVLFFEHKRLYALQGEVERRRSARLGEAAVVREGRDVTLVTAMKGVHDASRPPRRSRATGSTAEVIDLRTLRPFDLETVLASVAKTNRLVVVEEGPLTGGWAGEVLACVTEHALGHLDDAWRIATPTRRSRTARRSRTRILPGPERIAAEVASDGYGKRTVAVDRPSFEPSTIGPRLRAARENRGISLRELARRVGVSPSLFSQIELDRVNP